MQQKLFIVYLGTHDFFKTMFDLIDILTQYTPIDVLKQTRVSPENLTAVKSKIYVTISARSTMQFDHPSKTAIDANRGINLLKSF